MSKVSIEIAERNDNIARGTINVGGKIGAIEIYSDGSYTATPGWLGGKAEQMMGKQDWRRCRLHAYAGGQE